MIGLDDQAINIANDVIGCSDVKILEAKTMIDMAKESNVLDDGSCTSDKKQLDKLLNQLRIAEDKKKISECKVEEKLKEMLEVGIMKIAKMIKLKTKSLKLLKTESAFLDDSGVDVTEDPVDKMEISFSNDIIAEIIKEKNDLSKHRKDLIEDGMLNSSMEKYLLRIEKQLMSAMKKLVRHLKSKITTEKFISFIESHSLENNVEMFIVCHSSLCQRMAMHRCGRCLSVSYCSQAA